MGFSAISKPGLYKGLETIFSKDDATVKKGVMAKQFLMMFVFERLFVVPLLFG